MTAALFPGLHAELLALLRALAPADWERPTLAGAWRVRDVVAHLLDGDLRKLSAQRDGHRLAPPEATLESDAGLLQWLNELNADWVRAAGRLSPAVLIDLLAVTGPAVAQMVASLDPFGPALFPVAWAGESASLHWMDIGREYTERWHHQQQVRDAVGAPLLNARRWLHPVLAISLRALPHRYREVTAPEGACLAFEIAGGAGGIWSLTRESGRWALGEGPATSVQASVVVAEDDAWRIFFKALSPAEAALRVRIGGDTELAKPFLDVRAVMA